MLALERLEDKHVSQQGVIAELHYELSQKEEKVNVLGSQCQAAAAEVERMMKESRLIAAEKTRLLSENAELLLKCGQQTEQVTALTEQIERCVRSIRRDLVSILLLYLICIIIGASMKMTCYIPLATSIIATH